MQKALVYGMQVHSDSMCRYSARYFDTSNSCSISALSKNCTKSYTNKQNYKRYL